jgi:hypothetical protein
MVWFLGPVLEIITVFGFRGSNRNGLWFGYGLGG